MFLLCRYGECVRTVRAAVLLSFLLCVRWFDSYFHEEALINKQLSMVNSKREGDTSANFQQTQHSCVQDSDVFKVPDEEVVRQEKGLERNEDGVEHIKEGAMSGMKKKRASAKKFKSDRLIRESKSLLVKNVMHDEASDEDKAWIASLSDVEVNMLISVKKLAMERAKIIQDERVNGIFTLRVLRTTGLLLKEFIKDRLKDVHFPAQATEALNIQPNSQENRFSPKTEEESNHIIHQDFVGDAQKEMSAGPDRRRKRHAVLNS